MIIEVKANSFINILQKLYLFQYIETKNPLQINRDVNSIEN